MAAIRSLFFDEIERTLEELMIKVRSEIREELTEQGHVNTGALRDSIDYEIKRNLSNVEGVISLLEYGQNIDQGIKAENVPFSAGSGAGSSDYINGLIKYFQSKGENTKEATRIAFAVATTAKREGHPTKGSFAFSSNGRRTGFFSGTIDRMEGEIFNVFDRLGEDVSVKVFNRVLNNFKDIDINIGG